MKNKRSDWEKRYSMQYKLLRYKIYDAFINIEEGLSVVYPLFSAVFLVLGLSSGIPEVGTISVLIALMLIIRACRY